MGIRPCGHARPPSDDRDDVVELDFADTSALNDVDARTPATERQDDAKHLKRDNAREREEIERSWDVPGKSTPPIPDPWLSYVPAIMGRPSQPQAHLPAGGALGRSSSFAFLQSPHPPSGAGSSVKPSQPDKSASELVKTPEPSSSTGGLATAPPSSNNESRSKAKAIPNGPNGEASTSATMQAQINRAATVVKSTASAAVVEAVHPAPNGNDSLLTKDRSRFVREVVTLFHIRPFSSFHLWRLIHFPWSIR